MTVLSHPVAERLGTLRLPGMKTAFLEQIVRRDLRDMPFEDRLALLIDREVADRRSRALQRRLKRARLRHQDACFEEINLTRPRGLDRSVVLALGDCAWIHNAAPILITGPTGTGKSWISCALAHKACLEGFQALYLRVPRLLNDLRVAHGEGTIAKFYRDLARIDLLVLDLCEACGYVEPVVYSGERGDLCWCSWLGPGIADAHGGAVQLEACGAMNEAIEDSVCEGWIFELSMPVGHRQLGGYDDRAASGAVVEDFEQIAAARGFDGRQAPVVE